MRMSLTIAALAITGTLLTAQSGTGVAYVSADKVTAALAAGGPLVTQSDVLVQGSHRNAAGQVEVHDKQTDILYIIEGEATFVSGGTMAGGRSTGPGQWLGDNITGGTTQRLRKGDIIVIPAGIPHWFRDVPTTVSYLTVKVLKP